MVASLFWMMLRYLASIALSERMQWLCLSRSSASLAVSSLF